jgi:hypothetical protein
LKKKFTGLIVASQVEVIGETEMRAGFITIKISEDEYLKLDVGSYTTFDTLDEGARICAEINSLGATGILYVKKVTLLDGIN